MKFLFEETVDSTNEFAKRWMKENILHEPVCICTNFQTHGKGQGTNTWSSAKAENLLGSIIFPWKKFPIDQHFEISRAAALGIVTYLRTLNIDAQVKWPNDVYIENDKISGLLIENSISQKYIQHSIIGIGLNVNQTVFDDNIPNPTSIKNITAKHTELNACMLNVSKHLSNSLNNLTSGSLKTDYDNRLYLKDQWVFVKTHSSQWKGKIIGTAYDGKIEILNEANQLHTFVHGEVTMDRI